jgi:hypothetical protein
MTARTTYAASVTAASAAQIAAVIATEMPFQETINAAGCNVGYSLQSGNYGNLAAAVKTANLAKLAALNAAEIAKQAAIAVARDTLRTTGDVGSV